MPSHPIPPHTISSHPTPPFPSLSQPTPPVPIILPLRLLCPPLCDQLGSPLHSLDSQINFVNARVQSDVVKMSAEFPGRVRFCNCGGVFRNESGESSRYLVRSDLMPDGIHPNAVGQRVWAECMAGKLSEWS